MPHEGLFSRSAKSCRLSHISPKNLKLPHGLGKTYLSILSPRTLENLNTWVKLRKPVFYTSRETQNPHPTPLISPKPVVPRPLVNPRVARHETSIISLCCNLWLLTWREGILCTFLKGCFALVFIWNALCSGLWKPYFYIHKCLTSIDCPFTGVIFCWDLRIGVCVRLWEVVDRDQV